MAHSPPPYTGLFGDLVAENAALHDVTLAHPFVRSIGTGTLQPAAFRHYLEQDFQFLTRYLRVIALAVASAPDTATMARMTELLHATLAVEIDALRALYASFEGAPAALDTVVPAPACRAYTDHLLRVAHQHDLLVTLAAMLPCQWGYGDIGRTLLKQGLPQDSRFAGWISEYASDEYHVLVDWAVSRFNLLADEASCTQREAARAAFSISAAYELDFWEMAWTDRWQPAAT